MSEEYYTFAYKQLLQQGLQPYAIENILALGRLANDDEAMIKAIAEFNPSFTEKELDTEFPDPS
jgi:hypothetical protein